MTQPAPLTLVPQSLADARAEIDRIDSGILLLLAQRQVCVDAVARAKDSPSVIHDETRETSILTRIANEAISAGVDPEVAANIWRTIMREFSAYQARHWNRIKP